MYIVKKMQTWSVGSGTKILNHLFKIVMVAWQKLFNILLDCNKYFVNFIFVMPYTTELLQITVYNSKSQMLQ